MSESTNCPATRADERRGARTASNPVARRGLFLAGAAAVGYAIALSAIGELRNNGDIDIETARGWLVGTSVFSGALFVGGMLTTRHRPTRRRDLLTILVVAGIARLILIPADPIFVSDFYRYLWDGACTANGVNPFTTPPADVLSAMERPEATDGVPVHLTELARDSGRTIHRINHPHLSTIYPATAQAAFTVAYWIKPWSLPGLRCVLLLFDGATLGLLILLLRRLNLPLHQAAWYAWNPILLREVIHSAHMDVIILPFVLAAVLLVLSARPVAGFAALALAVAAKVWPFLLTPLLLRRIQGWRRRAVAVIVLVGLSLLLWWPTFGAMMRPESGFRAYSVGWEDNDIVFRCIQVTTSAAIQWMAIDSAEASTIARGIAALAMLVVLALVTIRMRPTDAGIADSMCVIVAALFLLCPSQFPWYYVWLLPLLALRPVAPLLAYTVLLPLYYACPRYPEWVWVEHLPILAWLAWVAWRARRHAALTPASGAVA